MSDQVNSQVTSIFVEMNGRLPTVAEASDFAAHITLIRQFTDERDEQTPELLRMGQVESLLGCDVQPVDVDRIYELFEDMIAGMKLDVMIQESVYYWYADGKFYSDNLNQVVEIP